MTDQRSSDPHEPVEETSLQPRETRRAFEQVIERQAMPADAAPAPLVSESLRWQAEGRLTAATLRSVNRATWHQTLRPLFGGLLADDLVPRHGRGGSAHG